MSRRQDFMEPSATLPVSYIPNSAVSQPQMVPFTYVNPPSSTLIGPSSWYVTLTPGPRGPSSGRPLILTIPCGCLTSFGEVEILSLTMRSSSEPTKLPIQLPLPLDWSIPPQTKPAQPCT